MKSFLFVAKFSLALLISVIVSRAAHGESRLRLYIYAPPASLDWSSPRSLAQSAFHNVQSGAPHSIGHVNVDVACDNSDGQPTEHFLGGMTNADADEPQRLLVQEGYGMGVLLANMAGRLYSAAEIQQELWKMSGDPSVRIIEAKISIATCRRLTSFVRTFHAEGHHQNYGTPNRPRYREGGGCSAFGTAFLDLAGADIRRLFNWWGVYVRIPVWSVGGPLTGQFVPVRQFLLRPRALYWAEPTEEHFPLAAWEPERMFNWIAWVWNQGGFFDGTAPWQPAVIDGRYAATIDLTARSTPTEPIFLN